MISSKSLLAIAALVHLSQGLLRYPCAQLSTASFEDATLSTSNRSHLHQIAGGNGFDAKNLSSPSFPSCTTCRFKEDNSNYWTSLLNFKYPNGTLVPVPIGNPPYTGTYDGGMAVYYLQQPLGQASARVSAFPKGFRLNVGNSSQRTNTAIPGSPQAYALTHRCWNEKLEEDPDASLPGTGPLDTIGLPNRACPGGIRAQLFFPSCWNGIDLDSKDHASHVVYPEGTVNSRDGMLFFGGSCPNSHPVRVAALYLEVYFDTRKFNNLIPTVGAPPFVYSNGDSTGYGQHAGFISGWEKATLQKALDTCTDTGGDPYSCRVLTLQDYAQMDACQPKSFPIPL